MKKSIIFLTILVLTLILGGCKGKTGSAPKKEPLGKDVSYAFGMFIGSKFLSDNTIPDTEQFLLGMKDTISGKKTRFSEDEAYQKIQALYTALMEERESESMQEGIDFLVENAQKPGIITTSSGLQYEVVKEGSGKKPSIDNLVRVHYEGKLIDGTIFDRSYDRDPAEFPLGAVIPGWSEGVQLMSVGSKYRLFIPPQLAYGAEGMPPAIPPFSVLIFEVELLDILK